MLRAFSSSSSCFTFSLISFCFSSISLKNFKASLTLGLHTLQKNMILVDNSPLINSYSSLEMPAQAQCSHSRQDSHSILHVLFNILTAFDTYKDLTRLVFGHFRRWRASSSSSHAFRHSVKVKCISEALSS